jgi:hypothetical protein
MPYQLYLPATKLLTQKRLTGLCRGLLFQLEEGIVHTPLGNPGI